MTTLDASRAGFADRAAAYAAPPAVDRIQTLALGVGVAGALASLLGLFLSPDTFFRAYLVGWVYWMGVSLGSLALLMVHHLSRGSWGVVIRRILEAASRNLPLLFLLILTGTVLLRRVAQPVWPRRAACLLLGLLVAQCASQLTVTNYAVWRYDARTRELLLSAVRWAGDPPPHPLRIACSWQLEPAPSASYFAMKVTLRPILSAISFRHCL